MENDLHNIVLAQPETIKQKKTCKCCGKELPITSFHKRGGGYRTICMSCERTNNGISEKFKNFTDRELQEELRSRGYKGILKRMKVEELKF
ncbi:MAG: restriction endonuclease [crAssphage sp. isolate ctcc615]|uniref:Restriction endonuclease n=1 Tax=crAssphage sp. isolate ctcc615 TaxID=2989853 RepID=A0A345BP07_9CAUD|nr:MAG: restriction endonuclease [crAssphage sp. isolate ctcc615]AXF52178.1 MAG: restriction endonuclease [crAssphage sp. isolate ctcc615]